MIGVEDRPGIAFKIFNKLAKNNINVDIILQSVGRDGTKDISFTVSQDDLKDALAILEENKEPLTIKNITHNEGVAKVSIVGAGMMTNPTNQSGGVNAFASCSVGNSTSARTSGARSPSKMSNSMVYMP